MYDDNYDILFVCEVLTHLKDYTEVLNQMGYLLKI